MGVEARTSSIATLSPKELVQNTLSARQTIGKTGYEAGEGFTTLKSPEVRSRNPCGMMVPGKERT